MIRRDTIQFVTVRKVTMAGCCMVVGTHTSCSHLSRAGSRERVGKDILHVQYTLCVVKGWV